MDELTPEQHEELVGDLRTLLVELQQTIVTTEDHSSTANVELDQAAVGRLSRMDAIIQQNMADAQRRRNELRLKQIQVALHRVREGEYGDCKLCGDPIGFRRLKARPASPCCVECMRQVEQ